MTITCLDRIARSGTVAEASDAYLSALRDCGFHHVLYIARFLWSLPAAVLREKPLLFSSFPDSFVLSLTQQRLIVTAPWAVWSLANSGNIALQQANHWNATRSHGRIGLRPATKLAMDHGVHAGRVISLKDRIPRSHGVVLLNPHIGANHAEAESVWRETGREVGVLTGVLHLRLATLARRLNEARLTDRQREVLEWSSAGKSVAEIATILGLTAATVEKHLRLAREATGGDTTAHAILRAHLNHQIFPHEPKRHPFP